jgi:membrane-associated phospholipid phosphatase
MYKRIRSVARTPATVIWVRRYSTLGEHGAVWIVGGAVAAVVDRPRRARWVRASATVAGAYLLSSTVKRLIGRQRPAVESLPHLMATPTGLSFPSSHASSSFAAARAYGRLLPSSWLYAGATAMGLSRLYLGVHYPSDVAAGAVLGTAVGTLGR